MIEIFKNYVDWSPADEARLRELLPVVEPAFPGVLDAFYDKILSTPEMSKILSEGPKQVERLKASLDRWIRGTFTRTRDADYGASLEMVGHVHVRIGLDLHFMVTMMNLLSAGLSRALMARRSVAAPEMLEDLASVHKALTLDLALMLHTYREGRELKAVLVERQASWEKMREQENLALVGRMAASVAHEVKNPLSALSSIVQSLLDKIPPGSPDSDLGIAVLKRIDGLNRYIEELLQFTRQRPHQPHPVDPLILLREVLAFFKNDGRFRDVKVEIRKVDTAFDPVSLDSDQVQRMIHNLLLNAAEAQSGKGSVYLDLRKRDKVLEFSVEDRGPGVSDAEAGRIFEPFHTTKKQGTGLGLAQASQTAMAHGGRIRLEKPEEGGARFVIEIPL